MTKAQRIALQADWWPRACRAQGWKTSDRDLRLRVCMWAVSLTNPTQQELLAAIASDAQPIRWLESTNDLDNKGDVDAVKACLLMLADDLQKTAEVGQPHFGSARRKRDRIRDHLKCLALYQEQPKKYLAVMLADMFHRPAGQAPFTIRDLDDRERFYQGSPSQLERILMRLAKVVNQKRNENKLVPAFAHLQGELPLTIHEMKLTAGVYCDCAICARINRQLPPPPAEENMADFDPEQDAFNSADAELGNACPVGDENPF